MIVASTLVSCNANKKVSDKNLPNNDSTVNVATEKTEGASLEFLFRKLDKGIEFYAIGNEPSWGLDMDFEDGFKFKTMEYEFNCPAVEGHKAEDADVTIFRAKTEAGEIIISLFGTPCTDNMSGEKFSHRVEVDIKRGDAKEYTNYEGCGRYVFDQRIHDIWVLEKMNGKNIRGMNKGSELPNIEFNTTENRVLGNTGCNGFSGEARCYGRTLELGNIGSTKKYCQDAHYEGEFLKTMEPGRYGYRIDSGMLFLKKGKNEVLVFRKVD